MAQAKQLYLVFSSTRNSMGRFLRVMTHNRYNHVSVSLDPGLATLYSFARRYKKAPFYGGFVSESCLRYRGKKNAYVKICAIDVTDSQYRIIDGMLSGMRQASSRYIYNTLSAALSPFGLKLAIDDAYTCVEFTVELLDRAGVNGISSDRFFNIKQLEDRFSGRVIYEGVFPDWAANFAWGDDRYNDSIGFFAGSRRSVGSHVDLLRRAAKSRKNG